MTTEQLLEDCKDGSKRAQRLLFEKYYKPVYLTVYRYLADTNDVEVTTSEVFVKCFAALSTFQYINDIALWSWIKRIAINESLKMIRSNKHSNEESVATLTEVGYIENLALSKLSTDEILAMVAELPDGYRLVFNLYIIEGYDHKAIAQMLDIKEETSRSQLYKAKRKLVEQLKKRQHG